MFGDINRVELMGNITSDLNLRTTNSGTQVLSFGLATNRRFKQGDEWKDQVEFHNVVVWGNQAQNLSARAKKGTRLFLSGRLATRSWEDQNNPGKKNYKTEVIADQIILIDRYEGKGENKQQAEQAPKQQENAEETIDPNDLPF